MRLTFRLMGLDILDVEVTTDTDSPSPESDPRDLSGGTTSSYPVSFTDTYCCDDLPRTVVMTMSVTPTVIRLSHLQRARGRWASHEDRVFAYVDADGPNGCWAWMGPTLPSGYGRVMRDRRLVMAHRAVWEINNGPIADGLVIDHLCRNRGCVNPDHLEPVEQGTNMKRGEAPTAIAIRTGFCHRGHERTPDNVYRAPGTPSMGHCRECRKIADRERRQRKRSSA